MSCPAQSGARRRTADGHGSYQLPVPAGSEHPPRPCSGHRCTHTAHRSSLQTAACSGIGHRQQLTAQPARRPLYGGRQVQAAAASRDAKARDEPLRAAEGRDVAAECRDEPPRAAMWPPKAAMSHRGPRCGRRRLCRNYIWARSSYSASKNSILRTYACISPSRAFLRHLSYIPSRKLSWI